MRLHGPDDLKYNDKRVWHEGNFDPASKANVTAIPTKLSQLENDIGAGAGLNIVVSATEPAQLVAGDWWYKEV